MLKITHLQLFPLCFSLCAVAAFADTVYLENDAEMKGVVVEEYDDRVVISTYEGEKNILKKDIHAISYDLTEQNLVALGDVYAARDKYRKAYFYYEKAVKINPKYKTARDKMNFITGQIFRESQTEKQDAMRRRQEIENSSKTLPSKKEDFKKELEQKIGIVITEEDNSVKIIDVTGDSSAYDAGLQPGDTLISVWGRFTNYMSKERVSRLLLESLGEIKIDIQRDVVLEKESPTAGFHKDIIGGKLDMLRDGLTLVDLKEGSPGQKAGLSKGDLIIAINGASTRYMPLADAEKIIGNKKTGAVKFTIRRDATIWRK
ncbi:MAG: PDZ domain-containing protein [Candidatus Omnitrophica bacterium]|nr:PDZ domain-containing protein [Candidatus Omnitrophota bacterium]